MRLTWILLPVIVLGAIAAGLLFVRSQTRAIQNPVMSFDMDPAGNTYSDPGAGGNNSITIGAHENCLTSATANTATHLHNVHIVIENVEDLVGWQARMRYNGDQFRPNTVNFMPFTDNNTFQSLSFLNLPIGAGVHRDQVTATDIPPGAAGPQSALVGSVYQGTQDFAISPDTPAKAIPDDSSYSTTGGGVLASMTLQVVGNQTGQASLFVNLDNIFPNGAGTAPDTNAGSAVQVLTATGVVAIDLLPQTQLGDAFHGEGATCVALDCSNFECPGGQPEVGTPTPTPGPETPTPTLAPGQTPGPGGTRTPTARPAGTATRTPTPASAVSLPDTGAASQGPNTLTYVVLFGTALAVAATGTAVAVRRLRKDDPE